MCALIYFFVFALFLSLCPACVCVCVCVCVCCLLFSICLFACVSLRFFVFLSLFVDCWSHERWMNAHTTEAQDENHSHYDYWQHIMNSFVCLIFENFIVLAPPCNMQILIDWNIRVTSRRSTQDKMADQCRDHAWCALWSSGTYMACSSRHVCVGGFLCFVVLFFFCIPLSFLYVCLYWFLYGLVRVSEYVSLLVLNFSWCPCSPHTLCPSRIPISLSLSFIPRAPPTPPLQFARGMGSSTNVCITSYDSANLIVAALAEWPPFTHNIQTLNQQPLFQQQQNKKTPFCDLQKSTTLKKCTHTHTHTPKQINDEIRCRAIISIEMYQEERM